MDHEFVTLTPNIVPFFNYIFLAIVLRIYITCNMRFQQCSLQDLVSVTAEERTTQNWYISLNLKVKVMLQVSVPSFLHSFIFFSSMKNKCAFCYHFMFCLWTDAMGSTSLLHLLLGVVLALLSVSLVEGEDAYKYYTWTVTYGILSPLGSPQQVGNIMCFHYWF